MARAETKHKATGEFDDVAEPTAPSEADVRKAKLVDRYGRAR
jgi:hypothetical protein